MGYLFLLQPIQCGLQQGFILKCSAGGAQALYGGLIIALGQVFAGSLFGLGKEGFLRLLQAVSRLLIAFIAFQRFAVVLDSGGIIFLCYGIAGLPDQAFDGILILNALTGCRQILFRALSAEVLQVAEVFLCILIAERSGGIFLQRPSGCCLNQRYAFSGRSSPYRWSK